MTCRSRFDGRAAKIMAHDVQSMQRTLIRSRLLQIAAVWLAWSMAVTFCYYQTNVTFLRAESGYFQIVSHSAPAPHYDMLRHFFTHSYNGHYAPLAFSTELELTYLIGPREPFWKWRQLAAVSFLATCLSLLVFSVARIHRLPGWHATVVAAGITAVFVFQPLLREFVAWPFLIFQLTAFILTALTVFALVQWTKAPTRKSWIWLAAAFSYLSMNAIGFGLATVLATAAVFAACLCGLYAGKLKQFLPVGRTLLAALATLLLFAAAHVICMQVLRPPGIHAPTLASVDSPSIDLGFSMMAFLDMMHALISFNPPPYFANPVVVGNLWPWGLFFLTLAISLLILRARACLREPSTEHLVQFALYCFSITAFFAFLAMMIARHVIDSDPSPIYTYLVGSRYLVPGNFMLFGSVAAVAVTASRRAPNAGALLFLILGLTALIAGRQFGVTTYRQIDPRAEISHAKAWRSLASLARECRAASLPVPNVPMAQLTEEFFDFDLKLYEPLLKYSLHLPAEKKIDFEPWEKIRGAELQKYQSVAPSFRELTRLLKLQVPNG